MKEKGSGCKFPVALDTYQGKQILIGDTLPPPHDVGSLWEAHADAIYAYAARRVGADCAEEVVADVFVVVVRRIADVPEDPLPWLYAVARNVVYSTRRARMRQTFFFDWSGTTGTDIADDVIARRALADALRRLSDSQRESLLLTAWEGLSASSAAPVAGCSIPAFAVRLHRAKRNLKRYLAEELNPASARSARE